MSGIISSSSGIASNMYLEAFWRIARMSRERGRTTRHSASRRRVSRLPWLADPVKIEEIEVEAKDIWQRGNRHIIWAGMGGSVLTVRVLCDLGFCSGQDSSLSSQQRQESITIYPLDSTDPAALNSIVRRI